MRLIDVDKLLKDIHDSGNTYEAWIYECILNQEVIDQEKEIEKVKADLCKILDSYSTVRVIDVPKMDVDKFKEEMSKVRPLIHPIEKQAAIHHGCHDCEYQPKPLMTCDWLHHQTTIFVQCPRWKARMIPSEQHK